MNILKIILKSLIPNFKVAYFEFKIRGASVPFKTKLSDFLSVLRNTGFYLFFAIIAFVVFLVISPGRDALLLVIEDVHYNNPASLISLLTGIFTWSIISEFGVRYSIYVTDNSGKSLSSERVEWRKFSQHLVAGICLLLPSVLIILSLIVIEFTDYSIRTEHMWRALGITLFLVYWLLSILTNLYFRSYKEFKGQKTAKKWFFSADNLSPGESYWTNKIYGIYNDYVFILPKPGNYLDEEQKKLKSFTGYFEDAPAAERDKFPQNQNIVITGVRVPAEFEFKKFENGGSDNSESFRWIYLIPLSFYKVLHKQVLWIAILALAVLLTISFLPADDGILEIIGAPGLLCGSFACWIGIYTGVLYADYALLRHSWFSLRFFFLILLLASSYFNNDHPVRVYESKNNITRVKFKTHFESWFKNYKREVDSSLDSGKKADKYPVVFICAEGGALRTGAYTAIFLDNLQHDLALKNIDFKKSVYAMSGVSGGSLGLGYFNAANYINKPSDFTEDPKLTPAERFFQNDCLSPIIGKMFYGDLLNLLIPFHISRFDRAIALENSWEYSYKKILKPNSSNTFSNGFLNGYQNKNKSPLPLFLINTTEVETGNQCWVTNVVPGNIIFSKQRDLFLHKINNSVRYSTAINLSSRFPLLSPGGMLRDTDKGIPRKLHYVDGGYYENTGAGSMYELLTQIRRDSLSRQIYPIVIYLRFSNDPTNQTKNINFGNEITEIISGIYDTRDGRTYMAVKQLNQLATYFDHGKDSTGTYIDEPLSEDQRQVPMNWVLSGQSIDNIKKDVAGKLNYKKGILPMITNCKYPFPLIKANRP
jgi:hypothetical protein